MMGATLLPGVSPASASGADGWGADRQSAGRDGYNADETTITTKSAYLLREKWLSPRPERTYAAPAIADGTVYASLEGRVRALRSSDGRQRWSRRFADAGEPPASSVALMTRAAPTNTERTVRTLTSDQSGPPGRRPVRTVGPLGGAGGVSSQDHP